MEPTQPTQPPSDPPPPEQPPQTQLQPAPQPQPSSQLPPSSSSSSSLHPSSASPIASSTNPNPNPKTLTPLLQPESQSQQQQQQQQQIQQLEQDQRKEQHDQLSSFQSAQSRPPLGRQWQQPSHLSHFQPHHIPPIPGPSTTSASSSPSPVPSPVVSGPPRGGTAISVPAIRPGLTAQANAFASNFGYGGVPRNPASAPEQPTNSSSSTGRLAMHGVQTTGMMGPQMQHGVLPGNHPQRPVQLSYRPQSGPINQSSPSQSFQGHGIVRSSSVSSPNSAMSTSQGATQNQAWLSSVSHGRPPMAIPPRAQMNPQSLQQRSQMTPQPHLPMPLPSQPQQVPASQQQQAPTKSSNQQREHPVQHVSASRNSQSVPSQQQIARPQGAANQKPSSTSVVQPSPAQSVANDSAPITEADELNKRIISKRSIQEIVTQIDPSERLDPDVEDIMIDIAEEFVESITTFGCSLAKHRRSSTLEAKDILLHLERNWNMTLPGFVGDEIKTYKKPLTNDVHRERLTVVRKSIAGAETGNTKSIAGQSSANAKGHLAKAPPNVSGH